MSEVSVTISEDRLKELLAEAVEQGSNKAIETLKTDIIMWAGRSIIQKVLYLVGIFGFGLYMYFHDKLPKV